MRRNSRVNVGTRVVRPAYVEIRLQVLQQLRIIRGSCLKSFGGFVESSTDVQKFLHQLGDYVVPLDALAVENWDEAEQTTGDLVLSDIVVR